MATKFYIENSCENHTAVPERNELFSHLIKNRPKHVLAIYSEPSHVEVLRAHRQWRSWQVDAVEQFEVPEGDNPYDYLQKLNLRVRDQQHTALVLFLPHLYFTFHREHYPATLQHQLAAALDYDWTENLFYEHERTLHFSGTAVPVKQQLSVPIFSLPQDIFEKFNKTLGGQSFQTFSIVPSALSYKTFLPASRPVEQEASPLILLARLVDPLHLEIHRFYQSQLLDSAFIARNPLHLQLFLEGVRGAADGDTAEQPPIHLICTEQEHCSRYVQDWLEAGLSLEPHPVDAPLLDYWVKDLLQQDRVDNFYDPVCLKPIEIPRITWLLAPLIALYAVFAFYQIHSYHQFVAQEQSLQQQQIRLATEWKPIEQLQSRVAKFKQDRKTLSEFPGDAYPVLGMLTLLSQITPQDTWLNYLSFRRGQLLLRGESKSAIKYLTILSKTGGFENVRFASPVTRNPITHMERFNIATQLDRVTLDKSLSQSLSEQDKPASTVHPAAGAGISLSQPHAVKAPIDENSKQINPTADN